MGSSSCTRMLEAVAWCALAVSTDVEHIFDDSDRSNRVAITTLGTVSEATPKKRSTAESRAVREWAFVTGDKRSSLVLYRSVRKLIRMAVFPLLRVQGTNVEVLDLPGPTILAPVHRSHLDSVLLAALSTRRIRALGKESLFLVPVLRYLCAALGAIPVRRGEADREAAKTLLDRGESMIVFPEGGRQSPGSPVVDLFDGAAWLASKTGARVVPVGIVGTGEALGEGSKFLRRSNVRIVVGEPMEFPVAIDGKRADREQLAGFTASLRVSLDQLQEEAAAREG